MKNIPKPEVPLHPFKKVFPPGISLAACISLDVDYRTIYSGAQIDLQMMSRPRSLIKLDGGELELATETEYRALLYVAWRSQILIFSQFCR